MNPPPRSALYLRALYLRVLYLRVLYLRALYLRAQHPGPAGHVGC